MTLVVDASVAVKWMVKEPGNDAARALLDLPDPLIAPDWLLLEAASTLWKKVKSSQLLEIHALRHIDDLPDFFSRLYASRDLARTAMDLGFRLRHPVYDCLYLALAQREGCKLVTADEEFFRALKRRGFEDQAILLEY
jgi:predicted nucleic acid-binding protein